jgi:hypothetical protein
MTIKATRVSQLVKSAIAELDEVSYMNDMASTEKQSEACDFIHTTK